MLNTPFKIPFHIYSLDNWEEKKRNILGSLPDFKDFKLCGEGSNPSENYSDFHANFDKAPSYAGVVVESIRKEIVEFCEETQLNWDMLNMWFQSYEKSNNFSIHNHGGEGYSAVLYVEYDSQEHPGTVFYSPFPNWIKNRAGTYEAYVPDVKEGDLIIFPASIQHEVPQNRSEKRRTVISFNLK